MIAYRKKHSTVHLFYKTILSVYNIMCIDQTVSDNVAKMTIRNHLHPCTIDWKVTVMHQFNSVQFIYSMSQLNDRMPEQNM